MGPDGCWSVCCRRCPTRNSAASLFRSRKNGGPPPNALEASNPYGVRFPSWVLKSRWKLDSSRQGGGGGSIQGFDCDVLMPDAMRDYFYHKHLPEVFGADTLLNVVNYILGCHPANNRSQVSGVGANSALLASALLRSYPPLLARSDPRS